MKLQLKQEQMQLVMVTGKGNDQVRFELEPMLNPDIEELHHGERN